ncbi:phospholipase [Nonomuraea salmonea]|uniref:phospholipase n=1 Tax=Nonomuraea salmonea TaxID=46181 RepID=UPI0031F0A17A
MVTVTGVGTAAPTSAAALQAPDQQSSASLKLTAKQKRKFTDMWLYEISMSAFQKLRVERPYAGQGIDWSSDACSKSPDRPSGFNFKPSCQRHDFGYRNYKKQNRFTEDNRHRIDKKFRRDMYDVCDKFDGWQSAAGVFMPARSRRLLQHRSSHRESVTNRSQRNNSDDWGFLTSAVTYRNFARSRRRPETGVEPPVDELPPQDPHQPKGST